MLREPRGQSTLNLVIRRIREGDPASLCKAFEAIGWRSKSEELFERYRQEEAQGQREVLLAFLDSLFAGYVTVNWMPTYGPLAVAGVPELQDLNVLPEFRRRGIGSRLIAEAETLVGRRARCVGIAVGLHPGYNAAQRLYAALGYVPDGNGITVRERSVREGESIVLDDDVALHLEKSLSAVRNGELSAQL
jgi:GNAT superfamily N-acetyltransferase